MGFLGESGVTALWNKVRANFGRSLSVSGTTITLKNGAATPSNLSQVTIPDATTSTAGAMSAADKAKLEGIAEGANKYTHPSTLSSELTSLKMYKVAVNRQGHITSTATVSKSDITGLGIPAQDTTYDDATTSAAGLMSAADKGKLDGIAAGANAYTHPSYTAKSSGLYKVTVDATGHVSAATAATKDDITALGIPAQDTNTHYESKNVVGKSTSISDTPSAVSNGSVCLNSVENGVVTSSHKITGSGGVQVTAAAGGDITVKGTTYSAATTSTAGLMSAADKTKLDGIPSGAVSLDEVNAAIATAQVGAAMYQGSVSSNDTISASNYKKGWYWVVGTAGTYVGETCEAGDMIFAHSDKGGTYSASHFDVVQNNIVEMTASEVEGICTL